MSCCAGGASVFALLALLAAAPAHAAGIDAASVVESFLECGSTKAVALDFHCTQRRVQQIVQDAGITETKPDVHPDLEAVVLHEVRRHGANYGVKMLLGALRAHHPGWSFPRRAVLAVLQAADPGAARARVDWAHRRLERGVYRADHFMYSVHLDLACKLQDYGLYVGALIDGDSRMALTLSALTSKTPEVIYRELFEPCVLQYGLPDQLITDKGWEVPAAALRTAARAPELSTL